MRKSFKVIVLGIFIIVTTMLMFKNVQKSYEKKIVFNSPEEIIEVLNSNILNKGDKYGTYIPNNILLECLSKRKRITNSYIDYEKINMEYYERKNTEENKNRIKNEYIALCKRNLVGYKTPMKLEAATYKFEGGNVNSGGIYQGEIEDLYRGTVEMVFIDEGEGWVIDYFVISYKDIEE